MVLEVPDPQTGSRLKILRDTHLSEIYGSTPRDMSVSCDESNLGS